MSLLQSLSASVTTPEKSSPVKVDVATAVPDQEQPKEKDSKQQSSAIPAEETNGNCHSTRRFLSRPAPPRRESCCGQSSDRHWAQLDVKRLVDDIRRRQGLFFYIFVVERESWKFLSGRDCFLISWDGNWFFSAYTWQGLIFLKLCVNGNREKSSIFYPEKR